MNPYRILKTDNGYEIVRVSYDEDGRPKSMANLDFVSAVSLRELSQELMRMREALHGPSALDLGLLTYADFKREG